MPLLRHELTHLYAFEQWGRTEHGAWLTEGVAIWAARGCQGQSSDELAAGILARGAIVPLTQLSATFREIPEDIAMSQAGSVVTLETEWLAHLRTVKPRPSISPRDCKRGAEFPWRVPCSFAADLMKLESSEEPK